MATTAKTNSALKNSKLFAGIQKRFPTLNLNSFPIGGSILTLVQVVAAMQPIVDAGNAVLTSRSGWQTAVQADRVMQAQSKAFLSAVKQAIYVLFGNNPDALADFGLLPKKVRVPLTPAARVVAAAKSAATRKARGTSGKKAKQAVHGTVADTIGVSTAGGTGGKPAIIPPPNAVPANGAGGSGGGAVPAQGNGGGVAPAVNGGTGTHG